MEILTETQHAARDLMGYYGIDGGYVPGGFTTKLIALWEHADTWNRLRLSKAFPEMGEAVAALGISHDALRALAYPSGNGM